LTDEPYRATMLSSLLGSCAIHTWTVKRMVDTFSSMKQTKQLLPGLLKAVFPNFQ